MGQANTCIGSPYGSHDTHDGPSDMHIYGKYTQYDSTMQTCLWIVQHALYPHIYERCRIAIEDYMWMNKVAISEHYYST